MWAFFTKIELSDVGNVRLCDIAVWRNTMSEMLSESFVTICNRIPSLRIINGTSFNILHHKETCSLVICLSYDNYLVCCCFSQLCLNDFMMCRKRFYNYSGGLNLSFEKLKCSTYLHLTLISKIYL